MRIPVTTVRRAPLCLTLLLLLPSCGAPPATDPLDAAIRSLAPGETVIYARTLAAGVEEAAPEGIVAVVRDGAGRLVLRVYEWDGRDTTLAHESAGDETFENLDLYDADGDGRRDIVVVWGGGQLSQVEVIGRQEDDRYRTLFENAGSAIEIRQTPAGELELLVTGRTYEEQPGQPIVYESIPYRWDGARFSPFLPAPSE
jgi:hypothetical protein